MRTAKASPIRGGGTPSGVTEGFNFQKEEPTTVSYTHLAGAADGLHQSLLDDTVLDVQRQLAGALLVCTHGQTTVINATERYTFEIPDPEMCIRDRPRGGAL